MAALRRGGRCGGQERRSVVPGTGDRPEWVRYALPRHKRGGRVGPGRARKLTRAGTSGVVDLSLIEFLDRLAALIPPPRKHWHLYHGVFAPNHPLRRCRHGVGDRKHRQAARGCDRWACERRSRHGRQLQRDLRAKSRGCTTRHGFPGRNPWRGWVGSFRSSARTAAATSG